MARIFEYFIVCGIGAEIRTLDEDKGFHGLSYRYLPSLLDQFPPLKSLSLPSSSSSTPHSSKPNHRQDNLLPPLNSFVSTCLLHRRFASVVSECTLSVRQNAQVKLLQVFDAGNLIWENILGFENAEFYIKRWPHLDGACFEDILLSFPDAVPCGVKVAAKGGKIILNPEDEYVLREGDEILVIAEDDDSYYPAALPQCSNPTCFVAYHPLCARVSGYCVEVPTMSGRAALVHCRI